MAENLTRYQTTPPTDVVILYDRQSLNDFVKENPDGLLHAENGGYYLKDMEESIVAIASDGLCNELDGPWTSAAAAADAEDAAEGDAIDATENDPSSESS